MLIHSVENFIPIIVPQCVYIDKHNSPNAYHENNISLHIDNDGLITILVRRVNYRNFGGKQWYCGLNMQKSIYCVLRGTDFNTLEHNMIIYDWNNFPDYGAYWSGMDDIRFIDQNNVIITNCDRNIKSLETPCGSPCLFLGKLENNTITMIEQLKPSDKEKNWMLYSYHDQINVIYSVSPLVIKSLKTDNRQTIKCDNQIENKLAGYHGSTNGIPYQGQLLFLVHKYVQRTEHRWLLFDPTNLTIQISEPFVFFKYSFVEFNCTISWYNHKIYAALAVNEDNNYIAVINPNTINII
jgi:hypothetical protein